MLSSGGEANEGLRPAGLPHRRAPLLIVLLIPLLACLGTATAAQGRYGLRGPAPSRALAADGRRLVATAAPTRAAEGANATNATAWDAYEECERRKSGHARRKKTAFMLLFFIFLGLCPFFLCFIITIYDYEEPPTGDDYDDGDGDTIFDWAYAEADPRRRRRAALLAGPGARGADVKIRLIYFCVSSLDFKGHWKYITRIQRFSSILASSVPWIIFLSIGSSIDVPPKKCKTIWSPPPTLAPTVTFAPTPFPTPRPTPRPTPFPTPQPSTLWPTAHPSLRPTAFGAKVVSGDLCISGMTEDVATSQKSVFAEAIEYYASTTADVWYSVSVDVSSGCLARRRRLQTASSDELTIDYDIYTDTSAAVNIAVAMGDLSPAAFEDALDAVVPNDLTNVFASVTLTNVGNPTLASGTHPVGTAAQKPQDGEDIEDGARSSPGSQDILLVGGVLSVIFCGYIYYVKKKHYNKPDDVSYQFYFVIGTALMDFYSDVFFAQSAVGSERSTVRTLGYVMIGWVVAVVTVNGVLLVTIYRKYVLERVLLVNGDKGDPFDKAHSGLFTILALLTLTSAELLAVFPWYDDGPNGFPSEEAQNFAEYAGWFEDLPQLVFQILVYSQGGDASGDLIACTVLSVTAMIVRTVMRRLAPENSRKVAPENSSKVYDYDD